MFVIKFDQCRTHLRTTLPLYCFQKFCNPFQTASRGVDDVGVNDLHDRAAARIDCSLSSLLSNCILLIVCLFTKEGTWRWLRNLAVSSTHTSNPRCQDSRLDMSLRLLFPRCFQHQTFIVLEVRTGLIHLQTAARFDAAGLRWSVAVRTLTWKCTWIQHVNVKFCRKIFL